MCSVTEGNFVKNPEEAEIVRQSLRNSMKACKLRGFCDVVMTRDRLEGVSSVIQTSGLGALRHNTIVLPWPEEWAADTNYTTLVHEFVDTIRIATACKCAILIPMHVASFPTNSERVSSARSIAQTHVDVQLTGTLDVWWVVHDGGMLMLLPFLLQQHKVWRGTKLRIFAVAQMEDNSVKMKKDLEMFLYHLRINAAVDVIEMVSACGWVKGVYSWLTRAHTGFTHAHLHLLTGHLHVSRAWECVVCGAYM
jgi:hypothetical protein